MNIACAALEREIDSIGVEETAAGMTLTVEQRSTVAQDIVSFELRDPHGAELPGFSAGAHVTLQLGNGMRRNYSLYNDPGDRQRYLIAVKRETSGRGGSAWIADHLLAGNSVEVDAPVNDFALSPHAKRFLFIAGGIGITPILSMMRHLKRHGCNTFRLVYLARDAQSTAFADEIRAEFPGQALIHFDHGERAQSFDLWSILAKPTQEHIYCCGPNGLMNAVRDMSGHWMSGTVHFESFGAPPSRTPDRPFVVHLRRSGGTVEVGRDESILDALRTHGHRVPSSCESGTCGSCRVRLLAGQADHRDIVLSPQERDDHIIVCVSRAKSDSLDLDL